MSDALELCIDDNLTIGRWPLTLDPMLLESRVVVDLGHHIFLAFQNGAREVRVLRCASAPPSMAER